MDTITSFINNNLTILGGLCLLGLIAFGVMALSGSRKSTNTQKTFDELQAEIRDILIPFGFEEKMGPKGGLAREVDYLRGASSVKLWWDIRDSIFYLDVASTNKTTTVKNDKVSELIGEYKAPVLDFKIEGHISEADKFKSDSIAKLNKWLFEQGIK